MEGAADPYPAETLSAGASSYHLWLGASSLAVNYGSTLQDQ
jgi:hypothetical protein